MVNKEAKELYDKVASQSNLFAIERSYSENHHLSGPNLPSWIEGQTLYQIYPRAFTAEGTFKAAAAKLSWLKNLGISCIWLMPVYPIGRIQKKGSLGCPYAVRDYFEVNPEFGSKSDFKDFIEQAHHSGMHVILDMVLNHVAPDYGQAELFLRDEQGRPARKVADWTDVVDLDYARTATREHALEILKYWVREFDVDGYRCDVAGLVPLDFWEWAIPQVNELKKELFWLAEWESPALHKKAFHSYYDWTLYEQLLKVSGAKLPATELLHWLKVKELMYPQQTLPMRFLENHDLQRAAAVFPARQMSVLLTFLFSISGLPLVYNGQELLIDTYSSLFEREPYSWPQSPGPLVDILRQLIALRKKDRRLSQADFVDCTPAEAPAELLVFEKKGLLIVLNFGNKEIELKHNATHQRKVLFNSKNNLISKTDCLNVQADQAVILD